MAVKHNIQLIMYGENGEVEYGGNMKNAFSPTREITTMTSLLFWNATRFLVRTRFEKSGFISIPGPKFEDIKQNNTEIHFFGYYYFWDPQENYYYCREHTGFLPNTERSEGTYSKYASLDDKIDGFHYYLSFIKFGIGRLLLILLMKLETAK